MQEIESINFKEIDQMIKKSLRESEEEERKELKAKVAKFVAQGEDYDMVATEVQCPGINIDRLDANYFQKVMGELVSTQEMSSILNQGFTTTVESPKIIGPPRTPAFKQARPLKLVDELKAVSESQLEESKS